MPYKTFFVYILTNARNTVLYVGVTNDLVRRITEHRQGGNICSFTKRYHLNKLVYYETGTNAYGAIEREKQIKGWMRYRKMDLVCGFNPEWKDLFETLI